MQALASVLLYKGTKVYGIKRHLDNSEPAAPQATNQAPRGKTEIAFNRQTKNRMETITILGLTAALFTTVSLFPQLFRVVKTKSTKDISTGMFSLFSGGVLLWFIYGLFIHDWPVIFANSIAFVLAVAILCLKLKYK